MTVNETGIALEVLQKLVAKTLYYQGTMAPSALSSEIKLSVSVINEILKTMQKLQLVESRGLVGDDLTSEIRYSLGGAGFAWVVEALEQSQYVGPAPVKFEDFVLQIQKQSIANESLSSDDLVAATSHLVIPDHILEKLGPAVNSARSILLYGDPGNGKTSIAESVGKAFKSPIYFPYCFEIGGQIINFFDPTIHTPVEDTNLSKMDQRWQLCNRPFILTGGELTLDMLDLSYNPTARFYEAPVHFKATNGVFVVDDFGRQRTDPQSVLNRWIVPLERRYDHLTLHTGKKFVVPFDQLAVFSTNKEPEDLADAAGLRRLHYKLRVPTPTPSDFKEIFINVVEQNKIQFDEGVFEEFYQSKYVASGMVLAGHHPKYLTDYIVALCRFKGSKAVMNIEYLNQAWDNLNVSKTDTH